MACLTQLSYYPQLAARACALTGKGATLAQIAQRLNAEGFRPPKRIDVFTPNAFSDLLRALGIQRSLTPARRPALAPTSGGCATWPLTWACPRSPSTPGSAAAGRRYLHPQAKLTVVRACPAEIARLRALRQVPRGQHNRRPWLKNQAALMNTEQEGASSHAGQPRL